jgi:esterase/lipase superfamily enzyme
MTPVRRRISILAAVAALLLLLLGILFRGRTLEALERAEAFDFRRMLVTRQGEDGTYRFFYATNRNLRDGDGALEERFLNERGESMLFGRFDTALESSLGIGMLINPSDWFQTEEIQVRNVRALEQAAFIQELQSQVSRSPQRSLLICINGFRERFPSALRKTAFVAHVLDADTPVLVFDWPSDQGSTPQGYRRAQRLARESGGEFAEIVALILEHVEVERVWILANSMGGEVVVNGLARLYENAEFSDDDVELEDVILTAPDVSYHEFGREFKEEIAALTKHLTVYVSSNDRALLMSRVLNRGRRLGESSVNLRSPDQLDEASEVFELVEPGSDVVTLIDVTPVNRTRNFHNFSLETPEFFDDLFLRITNPEAPRSRGAYRVRTQEGKSYWVLTRGR